MVNFDFEGWVALRLAQAKLRAQMQNVTDKDFYEGDPTYNEPANGISTFEVRDEPQSDPYEKSEVTDHMPHDADVGDGGEHGVWDSDDGGYTHRAVRVKADIAIHHPERYDNLPGYQRGQNGPASMTEFFPVDPANESTPDAEGIPRFEDKDVYQMPRGKPSTMSPGTSSDALPGTMNTGDGDLDGQTPHGFQEHELGGGAPLREEAEYGQSLSQMTGQGRDENPLSASPDHVEDWMGKNAMPMPTELPKGWKLEKYDLDERSTIYRVLANENGHEYAAAEMQVSKDPIKGRWWPSWVESKRPGGWGVFLYEQAMKDADAVGATFESDTMVTDDAASVWNKYYERPDIEKLPREMMSPVKGLPGYKPRTEESLKYRYRPRSADLRTSTRVKARQMIQEKGSLKVSK